MSLPLPREEFGVHSRSVVPIGDMMLGLVGDVFARRCLFGQGTVAGVRFSILFFNRINNFHAFFAFELSI